MRRLITCLALGSAALAVWPLTAAADTTTTTTTLPATIRLAPGNPSFAPGDVCFILCFNPGITFGGGGNSYSCSVSGSLQPASGGPQTYTLNGTVTGDCTANSTITVSACLQQATQYVNLPWGGAYPTAWGGDQSCTSKGPVSSVTAVSLSPSWQVTTPGCQAWVRMDMYVTGNDGVDPVGRDNQQSGFVTVGTGSYC